MAGKSKRMVVWVALAVMMAAQFLQAANSQTDTCTASLGNLNVCAPFVMPGAVTTAPSADCCSVVQSMDHDCICNTLRVAARIPAQCNIPSISCSAN
ncbi:PREDICTED: stamen-specific protein FIL1-like [Ipomoea nil]|uniref:stamen-specific protein FIL1-like n=1 Tax=Ipomoea nil TaxID=35883 RepID=UPI0009011097|nr:PREDICTED: stamen-specific protein FIL1-like [Ipomoea nil]